jgi:hypothetical protein
VKANGARNDDFATEDEPEIADDRSDKVTLNAIGNADSSADIPLPPATGGVSQTPSPRK